MTQDTPSQSELRPLSGPTLAAVVMVLALSNFIVVLDLTIANVSIPHIAGGLAVSPSEGTWVITSYAVAEAIIVPLNGWLVLRFGAVRCFILAVLMFGVFSALCGLATSISMLIVFRIFQGLAGGPLMPLTQTLLMHVFPKEKHSSALALWATTTVLGPTFGPILGGWITDSWSWHWIFLINVPLALMCGILAWRLLKHQETERVRRPIDYVGLGLLILWVGSLQLMLDKGRELDWFGSPLIVMFALVAAIGFAAFMIWELTADNPIVDLRVFRHRGFAVGAVGQCATFSAYFASIVLIPLWLQTTLGYPAIYAGYALALTGLASFLVSPWVGTLLRRFDPRIIVTFAIAWVASVTLIRTHWTSGVDFWTVALPQFLQGFGMPLFFVSTTTIALASINPREAASATGAMTFMRSLGIAFSTAIATTYWEHMQQASHAELAGILNSPAAAMATLQQSGLSQDQALATIDRLVTIESVTMATTQVFWITSAMFVAAGLIVWLVPRPRRNVDVSAAH